MKNAIVLPGISDFQSEAISIRRQIHAHPELGFEEIATSELVAKLLAEWGYEVARIAGTGVIATLRNGEGRSLGIRADMDALPIEEATGLSYRSTVPGKMHACGHDGHTAMLLAAARHLAQSRGFSGALHLIFQPAEEGLGGAARLLGEGLFERFPCDAVFAMHNVPGQPVGTFGFRSGAFMASADTVTIRIIGHGGHGAVPHKAVDPVVVCSAVVMALQTVVSRNVDPQDAAVITVGSIHSGTASNIIPDAAEMSVTVRSLSPEVRREVEARICGLVHAQAESFGARAVINYERCHPVLINHPVETEFAQDVARQWLGPEASILNAHPIMASEDFAFMLERCPGSYINIGNGEASHPLHNPSYDFNDEVLAIGATYWVKLAERFLATPAQSDITRRTGGIAAQRPCAAAE